MEDHQASECNHKDRTYRLRYDRDVGTKSIQVQTGCVDTVVDHVTVGKNASQQGQSECALATPSATD
jgi:hypothetical protein